MKRERIWNLLGVVIGIVIVIMGIVFCATPARHYYTTSVDSVSFGADFYTYEYEATKAVANNAAVAANNLRELSKKTAVYVGCGFIFAGLLVTLEYMKKLSCCVKLEEETELMASDIGLDTQKAEVTEIINESETL